MYGVILALHILICVALIAVVLVQSGKGGGLAGGAFGGSAQTVFGGRGAVDFVTRATVILGALFFTTSLTLAIMKNSQAGAARSLMQEEARRTAPLVPGAAPAPTGTAPGPGTSPAPSTTPSGAQPSSPAPANPSPAPPGGGR